MFYKASDASVPTTDWFSLSFSSVPWTLLAAREGLEEAVMNEGWVPFETEPPAWGYVFASDDGDRLKSEALCEGLRVMRDEDLGTFFAIDSGGHSFYEAYWIPLRARVAARQLQHREPHDRVRLGHLLCREYRREGGSNGAETIGKLLGLTDEEIAQEAGISAGEKVQ